MYWSWGMAWCGERLIIYLWLRKIWAGGEGKTKKVIGAIGVVYFTAGCWSNGIMRLLMSVIDGILTFPIESLKPLYPLVNTYVTCSFASELPSVRCEDWDENATWRVFDGGWISRWRKRGWDVEENGSEDVIISEWTQFVILFYIAIYCSGVIKKYQIESTWLTFSIHEWEQRIRSARARNLLDKVKLSKRIADF